MPKKAGLGDALKKVTAAPTTAPAPEAVHDDHRPPAAARLADAILRIIAS